MNNPQKLAKSYDHVLVGFNISSIQFAKELHSHGLNFCIIDTKFSGSGPFKEVPSLGEEVFARVPYNSALEGLEELVEASIISAPPLTFEKGDFRSFMGFGKDNIQERDVVDKYCQVQSLTPSSTPEVFWAEVKDRLLPYIFLDQKPTDLHLEGSSVTALTLNGNTLLTGQNFYFFGHLPFLFDKVGSRAKKLASQFGKASWYSSVNLIVHHKTKPEKVELNQLYLLKGSKEQACLGHFSCFGDSLISRWESFFPAELTPDSETTGACLKEIKKQVKRAFPGEDSTQDSEHIIIHEQIFADLSKLPSLRENLSNFDNLRLCSPQLSTQVGWYHERQIGQRLFDQLKKEQEKIQGGPLNEVAAPSAPC